MAEIIPLQQVYLMSLAGAAAGLKMDALLQDFGDGKHGRLWLTPQGNCTVPLGMLEFKFEHDSVLLRVATRDEQVLERVVKYAEGLDSYLGDFTKLFQAGRIAHRKAA
jgi:hypothetical protein